MAIRYTHVAELVGIVVRHVGGRTRYEALIKDLKASQAYIKNQSFRESMERIERQLKTGKAKPVKDPSTDPPKGAPRGPARVVRTFTRS
jgi:hypothetical protein